MKNLTETGLAVLAAALNLGVMIGCFVCGIPGIGLAFILGCLALFALEPAFSTHRGFLPCIYVAAICLMWLGLGTLGLHVGALHWL